MVFNRKIELRTSKYIIVSHLGLGPFLKKTKRMEIPTNQKIWSQLIKYVSAEPHFGATRYSEASNEFGSFGLARCVSEGVSTTSA